MSGLLDEVLTAHGGLERWRAVTALTAHGRFGGLLRSRFPGNRMTNLTVRVQLAQQHAVFQGFPQQDQQAVFNRGDVRIETCEGEPISTRPNARAAFIGLSGLRRNFRWDALDAAYFAGYAFWNYLSTPLLLTREGVTVTEGDTWPEGGDRWRRLEVSFPPDLHTHSRRQTFYVDTAGLIRRHDYVAYPVGRWARAAHCCNDYRRFAGLAFPTQRRVRPRGPDGRTLPLPILVALDIDHIEIET
ncbi:hypothetical protein ACIHDR_44605 [Nocardia sp. NPDC052278]|uniref:hypothetical protein n=1 Tax=unclassified Nocardia TaxID=2637762 RepID=UPI0036865ED6